MRIGYTIKFVITKIILAYNKLVKGFPIALQVSQLTTFKLISMPAKRISSKKIQNIFQLCQENKMVFRATANKLKISRRTLKKYAAEIRSFAIHYPERKDDLNFYLSSLRKSEEHVKGNIDSQNLFPSIYQAIANKGSTRKTEWSNYKVNYPDGYGYSRFCELFCKWCNEKKLAIIPPKRLSISVKEDDRQIFIKWKRSNSKRKWLQGSIFLEILNGLSLNQVSKKFSGKLNRSYYFEYLS